MQSSDSSDEEDLQDQSIHTKRALSMPDQSSRPDEHRSRGPNNTGQNNKADSKRQREDIGEEKHNLDLQLLNVLRRPLKTSLKNAAGNYRAAELAAHRNGESQ